MKLAFGHSLDFGGGYKSGTQRQLLVRDLPVPLASAGSLTAAAEAIAAPHTAFDLEPDAELDQLSLVHFAMTRRRNGNLTESTLDPAQWIWLPSERTLPNSFVLFRKEILLTAKPTRAVGWMTADSRYRLTVNGQRVQWGPAPCDPRQLDVDPIDLTALLRPGKNVIGVEVLYYGIGEGTWAAGKPGLLFHAVITPAQERTAADRLGSELALPDRSSSPSGPTQALVSAGAAGRVRCAPASVRVGHSRVRAPGRLDVRQLLPVLPTNHPPAAATGRRTRSTRRRPRSARCGPARFHWCERQSCPARPWPIAGWSTGRAIRSTGSTSACPTVSRSPTRSARRSRRWCVATADDDGRGGRLCNFEFAEQIVGFPGFEIEAPAGTIVELMTQEAHDPQATPWLDNHFYAWTRFICRDGVNRFEAFDYESLRWLQLHVRGAGRPVTIRNVGVRRRMYPWHA